MDMFNLAQLTKHLVVKAVKDSDKDPYAAVKAGVRDTLKTYLKGMNPANPEVRQGVMEVARGAMTGLLLADLALPPGAIAVLQAVSELAPELPHDPTLLMVATVEGIAEIRLLTSMDALALIQSAIDHEYMGTGEVFRKALEDKGTRDVPVARLSAAS